jgi:hypothetical protein
MQSRRDLLKYFGVGSVVVPLIGGEPMKELPARLIESANAELIQPQERVLTTLEGLTKVIIIPKQGTLFIWYTHDLLLGTSTENRQIMTGYVPMVRAIQPVSKTVHVNFSAKVEEGQYNVFDDKNDLAWFGDNENLRSK